MDSSGGFVHGNYSPPRNVTNLTSFNSHNYDIESITKLLDKAILNNRIEMPPTRDSLQILFEKLNLKVTKEKLFDCLIYCRGKKMEKSDTFSMDKFLKWFLINIRTLSHIDEKKAN